MKRIIQAFGFSIAGLISAYKSEPAFRQEVWLCVVLIPLAIFLDVPTINKILMISSLILVLITELINTAIEHCIDRISSEIHELSKKAKDVGSAIVLVALVNVAFIWGWSIMEMI